MLAHMWQMYVHLMALHCCFAVAPATEHAEGGMYISPEFQLGQVYDGYVEADDDVVLFKPVYVCIKQSSAAEQNDTGTKHNAIAAIPSTSRTTSTTPSDDVTSIGTTQVFTLSNKTGDMCRNSNRASGDTPELTVHSCSDVQQTTTESETTHTTEVDTNV